MSEYTFADLCRLLDMTGLEIEIVDDRFVVTGSSPFKRMCQLLADEFGVWLLLAHHGARRDRPGGVCAVYQCLGCSELQGLSTRKAGNKCTICGGKGRHRCVVPWAPGAVPKKPRASKR